MNIAHRLSHDIRKAGLIPPPPPPPFRRVFRVIRGLSALPALLAVLLILGACDDPVPVDELAFRTSAVFKSRMLHETRKTPQKYRNELLHYGIEAENDITYTIIQPADYASKKISIDKNTGELTFKNIPAAVTVQAAHPVGITASYTFTVTDHFSKRELHSSVTVGSDMYVIGGIEYNAARLNDVWKSSDGGKNWTQVTTSTSARFSARYKHSSAVLNQDIYVIGGHDRTSSHWNNRRNDVWKSTDGGRNWKQVPKTGPRFSPRSNHSSVVLDSDIYVIGGHNGFRALNDIWKSKDGGETWSEIAGTGTKFSKRAGHSAMVLGSDIYVIGGRDRHGRRNNEVWKSKDGGETWEEIAKTGAKFSKRAFHSSTAAGSAIYVMGGSGAGGAASNDVWKSTDGGETWRQAAKTDAGSRFPAVYTHSSAAVGSDIYVIGGYRGDQINDVWKSSDGGETWKNVHAAP